MMEAAAEQLRATGFAHTGAAAMRAALEAHGFAGFDAFAASWDDLGIDTYMADGGRYRRRRHAAFRAAAGAIERKPHQPHYQSRDYNMLNGGVERWFEPVRDEVAHSAALGAILRFGTEFFTSVTPAALRPASWHVELHQFRIEARPGEEGRPTPEGLHRDGVDWVLVTLIRRENVARGETTIATLDRTPLGSFTLAEPLESALVDDGRVYHGVTPVRPVAPARPAFRDVLVATWRRE